MTHNRPTSINGHQCPCGALAEHGSPVCRKCQSRERWLRRKLRRDETAYLHPESGTPNARRR
jgi:hypothetical protein